MSVSFKELGGSPVEQYGLDGFRARREFLIAWEDRGAFAAEVLGTAAQHGGSPWIHYPGKPTAFAVKLRYEPFDPENPDAQSIPDLTQGLNSYSGSFAKAVIDYETVVPRDRDDGPENELGTQLTYRMRFAAEAQPIPARGWTWSDDLTAPLADDVSLVKLIPQTEHHLIWHQVINPPWDEIQSLQGKVNSGEFLGCPQATLLFEGAEANKLFRAGFESGESAFCWQIHYVFRERSVKHGGQVLGWNHVYREKPAGWAEPTNGTGRLYDLADFIPLFQSAAN
ncbi:MAG: hypothetical protein ACYTG0_40825 [Planctomycetota bacterium]|jgi:hypothetical protein